MTIEYGGSGDPKRSIALLWGTGQRARRGPKPRLSVAAIAAAAIGVADAEGLTALSMRRVADQLGVTAMSLYTYVPGKAELLDVMVDRVYGELAIPDGMPDGVPDGVPDGAAPGLAGGIPDGPAGGWRARLHHLARENWDLYLRHPWLLQVATSRPVLGPNLVAKYEYELRAVAGIGLTDIEMDLVVGLVGNYVHGAVRAAVEAAQAAQHTGMTDEQWWQAYGPLLGEVFDAERYPLAARVGAAAGAEYGAASDPVRAFDFGLQRLLDGIEVLVRASGTGAGQPAEPVV